MAALVILLAAALLGANADFKVNSAADDLVKDIPGLHYDPGFKTYSGYLDAGKDDQKNQGYMHYMLTESKSNPSTDPLLLWLNGGPGCSSFSGAFEELGPFYVNEDGETLYENIYSWNANANVLFFESPIGVGYSFMEGKPNYTKASDDQTLEQNYNALKSFFNKFPTYQNRSFFIAGESYAGIYLPMLGAKLMDKIIDGELKNVKFQGIAIGNGYMDIKELQNALVLWSNYHGRISLKDWETLKSPECCIQSGTNGDADTCNFYDKAFNTSTWNDFTPQDNICGQILHDVITKPERMDPYNYYEDCYGGQSITYRGTRGRFHQGKRDSLVSFAQRYHNTASLINYNSTDFLFGYPCWQETAVATYFNRPDVQKAFHVDVAKNLDFHDCNDAMYGEYIVKYTTTTDFFYRMIDSVTKLPEKNFRILVYNGDVDTVCNFLGDAKFIAKIAKDKGLTGAKRQTWFFRKKTGGFVQTYKSSSISIDVLTVKGAGHMVPMDRPGPSMQMINVFCPTEGLEHQGAVVPPSCREASHDHPTPPAPPEKSKKLCNYEVRAASCPDGSRFARSAPPMCFTRKPLFARAARGSRRRSSSTLTSAPPHELKTGLLCSTVSGNSLFASPMSAHTDGIAVFYSDVLKPEEDRRLRSDNMVLVHTYDVSQGVSLRYEK